MFSSGQFSCSVVSDFLRPHGPQHTRLPCPSPIPRADSDSHPLSWWRHPTISSSVVPFSSRLQAFPASGSFPMSQFFTSGGQSTDVSASASVLPMNIQDWFPLGWTGWISLWTGRSKGLSRVFSNTTVQAAQWRSSNTTVIMLHELFLTCSFHSTGFLGGAVVKNLPANAGDTGVGYSILGLGRSPGEGNGNPLQYSCLGNSMDRGAWWATVYGTANESNTTEQQARHSTQWYSVLLFYVAIYVIILSNEMAIHCTTFNF